MSSQDDDKIKVRDVLPVYHHINHLIELHNYIFACIHSSQL